MLSHQLHPEMYTAAFHARHSNCTADSANQTCPTGLHTRRNLFAHGTLPGRQTTDVLSAAEIDLLAVLAASVDDCRRKRT